MPHPSAGIRRMRRKGSLAMLPLIALLFDEPLRGLGYVDAAEG